MKLNYKIFLPNHLKVYLELRDVIINWSKIQNNSGFEEFTTIDNNGVEKGYVITLGLVKESFEELKQKIFTEFSLDLSDGVIIDYKHYHISRLNDNYEVLHEATAFQIDEDVWEVYYTDGVFSDLPEVYKGTLLDEGIFIFKLEISNSKDPMDMLELNFDKWIERQK
ncbi:DUF3986 family protein [Peribacillus huizhouensis]|uniref:Uncharacterized protein n=1 Tax=Peribacillus huizhouensis TaxID=1501239 RepID=A0ABR6CWQ6_9BACI|nr:DUF3986 family protein [Peribacillus huizhouensis]MBA9029459.1 hypothetical protein [Peribacillus huizhouensis]